MPAGLRNFLIAIIVIAFGAAFIFSIDDTNSSAPHAPAGQANAEALVSADQILDGSCVVSSYIEEGQIGEGAAQKMRFYCDSAIITFLDNAKDRAMVTFAGKKSHQDSLIAFAGKGGSDGMSIDKIYLKPSIATSVSGGRCKFISINRKMSKIMCAASVDENENTNGNTHVWIEFYTDLHDDSSVLPDRQATSDYPDAKDAHDAFDQCLIKSIKGGDNWVTTADRCTSAPVGVESLGKAWCVELGMPFDVDIMGTLRNPPDMSMPCFDAEQQEETKVIMQYGDQTQKMEWSRAMGKP